jgi:hypothetical protein
LGFDERREAVAGSHSKNDSAKSAQERKKQRFQKEL